MKREKILINNWILTVAVVFMVLFACNSAMAEKTWTAGAAINTPVISGPSSGDKFGLSTVVTCTCNTPTDSDDWTEPPCDSGSSPDNAIEATWSDGDADGSWVGNDNKGTSVQYITPSSTGNVTLTVTFDDAGTTQAPDDSKNANVTIEVVDAKMIFKVSSSETSEITRAGTGSFEVVNGAGDPIDGATYANWAFDGAVDASDASNTSRTWSGTIVEEGTASCNVTFGGSTAKVSKTITVNARSGWSITPSFSPDDESSWGIFPGDLSMLFGQNYNTYLGLHLGLIHTHNLTYNNYEDTYTDGQVTSGPNKDVFYLVSSTLSISHASRINKFLKSGATGYPPAAGSNWHEYNEGQSRDADSYVDGVKNHEAYGTGGNRKGHQAFLEDKQDDSGMDSKEKIEDNVADSLSNLEDLTGSEIDAIENAIYAVWISEPTAGDNWASADMYLWKEIDDVWQWGDYTLPGF